jgi:tRNA(Ile)-lysidine synthetase-like protein
LYLLLLGGFSPSDLFIVSLDHKVRKESKEEVEFVKGIAEKEKIPFLTLERTEEFGSSPQELRRFRQWAFSFFLKEKKANGIILGHTLDDQREGRVFALLRGSGLKGLKGMVPWDPPYWRPLLSVPRQELRLFLKENGIPYREDRTNLNLESPRARLRYIFLPAMAYGYGWEDLRIQILQDEDHYLESVAKTLFPLLFEGPALKRKGIQNLHPALRRRILKLWVEEETPSERIEALHQAILHAKDLVVVETIREESFLVGKRYIIPLKDLPEGEFAVRKGEEIPYGKLGIFYGEEGVLQWIPYGKVSSPISLPKDFYTLPGEIRKVTPISLSSPPVYLSPLQPSFIETERGKGRFLPLSPTP